MNRFANLPRHLERELHSRAWIIEKVGTSGAWPQTPFLAGYHNFFLFFSFLNERSFFNEYLMGEVLEIYVIVCEQSLKLSLLRLVPHHSR